jgi:hypothetical protein
MRVILFIGHHKVGSSALQRYLAKNAPALLRQGILYPAIEATGMRRLRSRIAAAMTDPLHANIREAHNALAFGMMSDITGKPVPALHTNLPSTDTMLTNISSQIDRYQPHTVILASEVMANFSNMGTAPIARLLANFAGADVTVTATLRRVDDYMVSWLGQRLRFGHTPPRLSNGGMSGGIHFNYHKMIKPWADTCEDATWHLCNYADVVAAGGSVHHFFNTNSLPLSINNTAEARVNTGLHRALIEIARRGNAELEKGTAQTLLQGLRALGGQLDLPDTSDIELYGAPRRTKIFNRFAPVHAYLSDFVGHPFFPDINDMLIPRPVSENLANEQALIQIRARHLAAFPEPVREWLMKFTQ